MMRDNHAFSVVDRRAGLEIAAREGGCPFAVTHVEPTDEKGVAALLRADDAPDAIVCGNDLLAADLLGTLRSLGVDVPKDVMVAGFDDSPVAAASTPSLTTMHLPTNALATSLFKVMMIRAAPRRHGPQGLARPAFIHRALTGKTGIHHRLKAFCFW